MVVCCSLSQQTVSVELLNNKLNILYKITLFQKLAYILQTIFDMLMNQINKMGLQNTVNSKILLPHRFFYVWAVLNQLHINYKSHYYFYKTDISYSLNVSYLKLVLLFYFAALKETKCTAMENNKLTFTFPVNINSTQTDFSIYFYPDSGGEGKLFLQMFRLCVNT